MTGYGLERGVFCAEAVAPTSAQQGLSAARTALPGFPDAVLSLPPQVPWLFDDCLRWDVPAAPASVSVPVDSDVPALLLTGSLDAITPPQNADVAAAGLNNALSVVIPGAGHQRDYLVPAVRHRRDAQLPRRSGRSGRRLRRPAGDPSVRRVVNDAKRIRCGSPAPQVRGRPDG